MSQFLKSVLDNGIAVVTEDHPHTRSLSVGVFVETGTRDETARIMGVSHLLEHLVFKGTKKRDALEIVRAMESVGGELNAHTTREYTCYHTLSLHEHLDLAVDILGDLVMGANFPAAEFEKERQVVLQEIGATQDNIEEWADDMFMEMYFPKTSMGWPILGTEETIGNITRKEVQEFYKTQYCPQNLTVSAAGRLNHDEVVSAVEKAFGSLKSAGKKNRRKSPKAKKFRELINKDLEQVHILVGWPTATFKSPHRFEAFILNSLIGGGMTSRLYQSIREKHGLAYTIYSHLTTFTDTGIGEVYASTSIENAKKVSDLIFKEMAKIKKNGVRKKDLELFKTQVRGGVILGSDDMDNRMNSLAVNEMVFGEYRSVDRVVSEIEAVSMDSIHEFIEKSFSPEKASVLLIGPVGDQDRRWLEEL